VSKARNFYLDIIAERPAISNRWSLRTRVKAVEACADAEAYLLDRYSFEGAKRVAWLLWMGMEKRKRDDCARRAGGKGP
jgi:hypothetical protein